MNDNELQKLGEETNKARKAIKKIRRIIIALIPVFKAMVPIIAIAIVVFWASSLWKKFHNNFKELINSKFGATPSIEAVIKPASNEENEPTITGNYARTLKCNGKTYNYQHYDQWVEKNKTIPYGESDLYTAGCGIFSAAMCLSGLKNDSTITPESFLNNLKNYYTNYTSYYIPGTGSSQSALCDSKFLTKYYNIKTVHINPGVENNWELALSYLEKGYPIMGGRNGHVLAITPVTDEEKAQGYNFYVLDSINKSTGAYKSIEDFKSKTGYSKFYLNYAFIPV